MLHKRSYDSDVKNVQYLIGFFLQEIHCKILGFFLIFQENIFDFINKRFEAWLIGKNYRRDE